MTHYEAHITVSGPDFITFRDLTKFMDLTEQLGGKALIIQLLVMALVVVFLKLIYNSKTSVSPLRVTILNAW